MRRPSLRLAWAYVLDFNEPMEPRVRPFDSGPRRTSPPIERSRKDSGEPLAHFVSALVAGRERNTERAVAEVNAALTLSPNYAPARGLLAKHRTRFAGRPLAAIAQMERNMRLDPVVSQQGLHFLGLSYLTAGKYETAAAIFKQRLVLVPNSDTTRSFLASALGHLGEIEEARRVWDELKKINPNYSFAGHVSRLPFEREERTSSEIAEELDQSGVADLSTDAAVEATNGRADKHRRSAPPATMSVAGRFRAYEMTEVADAGSLGITEPPTFFFPCKLNIFPARSKSIPC